MTARTMRVTQVGRTMPPSTVDPAASSVALTDMDLDKDLVEVLDLAQQAA